MIDPRPAAIRKRTGGIRRVTGGKGGIGKSTVAAVFALVLARAGTKAGLLDLDLTGPCGHLFLGGTGPFPEEKHGLVPPEIAGVRFMSVAHFSGERPAPLRGKEITGALLEILTITRWPEVDTLVVDMPPGLGDATLDLMRILPKAGFLVVSTPSAVVVRTVRRTVEMLKTAGAEVLGVLENMARTEGGSVQAMAEQMQVPYLGAVPLDDALEPAIGDPERLTQTKVADALRSVAGRLEKGVRFI